MWDLIVSVPDHCLSFYFPPTMTLTLICVLFDKREFGRYLSGESYEKSH